MDNTYGTPLTSPYQDAIAAISDAITTRHAAGDITAPGDPTHYDLEAILDQAFNTDYQQTIHGLHFWETVDRNRL